jgi:hypothetical protein
MRVPGFILVVLVPMLALAAGGAPAAVANLPSETDGLIAFQRNDDAHGQIWLIDPSRDTAAVNLTSGTAPEARPAWGPVYQPNSSGPLSDLAFQRFEDGTWDIWKRTAEAPDITTTPPTFHDLGDAVEVVGGPGNQEQPAFSDTLLGSSGTTSLLAYISDATTDHAREIFLRDASGADHQLTSDGQSAGYANPDFAGRFRPLDSNGDATGTRTIGLTFERVLGGQRAIWAMDIDVTSDGVFKQKSDAWPVVAGPEALAEPSWQVTSSRDPSTSEIHLELNDILFTTQEAGTTYLDYVETPAVDERSVIPFLDLTKTRRFQLTGDPGGDTSAVWAPFGDQIAFTRTSGSNADLWAMSSGGTNLRRLTQDARPDLYPSWQPAQESSAEVVGGHTYPAGVTRGGGRGTSRGTTGNGPTNPVRTNPPPRRRASPKLSIRSARWHGSRVKVSGRTARGLRGRVRVAFSCGNRRRQHTQRRVRARSGRVGATLRVPRACRRARRGVVVAAYGGDSRYRSQRVSRFVRRR